MIPINYNDEEDKLLTKEHDYYFTPSTRMCESRLYSSGLRPTNSTFLKELCRFFYYQMIGDDRYMKDEFTDLHNLPDGAMPEHVIQKQDFYKKLFDQYIPGRFPLEKGANVLRILAKNAKKPDDLEQQATEEQVGIISGLLPSEEEFECQTWDLLLNQRGLNEFDKKLKYLNKIAMVKSFGKTFEVKKTVSEKKVQNSILHKQKRMTDYSEIIKTPLYLRKFPNYREKLITKDLPVMSPIKKEESKQKIIILVDFSGSMHEDFKQDWVLSILADRLYYAMKEECEIFFSFFIAGLIGNFTHIYNEETATAFFKRINVCPSGGNTRIGEVIHTVKREVDKKNGKFFGIPVDLSKDMPEILVINDGEDSVNVPDFAWKANAITLGSHNSELKALCEKSGGRYLTISRHDKIGN